ncbi:hypothetical protein HYX03_00070 [Candidatus Woesearchaeota archaeon]|nr:hypothetical protein [Candidatus Woesearchaeota archaeon]
MENKNDKFALIGLSASGLLLGFYLVVASLLGGFSFAIDNFVKLWYWMIPLIVGFGVQIGMFFYVKEEMHKKATAQAAASAGVSTTSMIACCAHHIADIAPFLGITALGLFLTKYQSTFLLAGIFSNALGITYMASLMNTKISKSKIKAILYSLLVFSIIAVFASYYFISKNNNANGVNQDTKQSAFQTLVSNENNVEFQVTPISPSEFQIAIDTHSVELDFDLAGVSALYDDFGNTYKPLKWEGSAPGGHHRNGILKFSEINKNTKSIKLVINDGTEREFRWNIK